MEFNQRREGTTRRIPDAERNLSGEMHHSCVMYYR